MKILIVEAGMLSILKLILKPIWWLIDDYPITTCNLKIHAIKTGAYLEKTAFTPRTSPAKYCAKLKVADIFLDTFPYSRRSTMNDVINTELSIVTISSKTIVSSMRRSILSRFGIKNNILTAEENKLKYIELVRNNKSTEFNYQQRMIIFNSYLAYEIAFTILGCLMGKTKKSQSDSE
jgi:predicted O-linked N-acetylglucosamine transferase (SPINDLY family)